MKPWGIEAVNRSGDVEQVLVGVSIAQVPTRKSWALLVHRPGVTYATAYFRSEEAAQRAIDALAEVMEHVWRSPAPPPHEPIPEAVDT